MFGLYANGILLFASMCIGELLEVKKETHFPVTIKPCKMSAIPLRYETTRFPQSGN